MLKILTGFWPWSQEIPISWDPVTWTGPEESCALSKGHELNTRLLIGYPLVIYMAIENGAFVVDLPIK